MELLAQRKESRAGVDAVLVMNENRYDHAALVVASPSDRAEYVCKRIVVRFDLGTGASVKFAAQRRLVRVPAATREVCEIAMAGLDHRIPGLRAVSEVSVYVRHEVASGRGSWRRAPRNSRSRGRTPVACKWSRLSGGSRMAKTRGST